MQEAHKTYIIRTHNVHKVRMHNVEIQSPRLGIPWYLTKTAWRLTHSNMVARDTWHRAAWAHLTHKTQTYSQSNMVPRMWRLDIFHSNILARIFACTLSRVLARVFYRSSWCHSLEKFVKWQDPNPQIPATSLQYSLSPLQHLQALPAVCTLRQLRPSPTPISVQGTTWRVQPRTWGGLP